MLKFAICLCLLAGFAGAEEKRLENEDQPPTVSNYVYLIHRNKVPVCTGTAIKDDSNNIIIVTAAHCVYKTEASALGVSLKTTNPEVADVKPVYKVHIHPYYMPPLLNYDVALLKLPKKTLKNPKTSDSFVEIAKEEPNSGSNLSAIKWDLKGVGNPEPIHALVEDRKSCRAKLSNHVTVTSKMLCVNFEPALVPDGSPLLMQNKIVGVASSLLKGTLPKIFTNIANSEIYSFIENYL